MPGVCNGKQKVSDQRLICIIFKSDPVTFSHNMSIILAKKNEFKLALPENPVNLAETWH